MQITKREFLKKMGLMGAWSAVGTARSDVYIPSSGELPPGSVGDPALPAWARNIFPVENRMEDGPSCVLKDGVVVEPSHRLPIFHETDVVVVGGGPAGFAAAVAAARSGVRVALIERYGSLGGLFTNGMVLIMLCTSTNEGGVYRLLQRGLITEFADRAHAFGSDICDYGTELANGRIHWQPTVDPEGAKYLMDTMVREAGVEIFFHAWGVDVIQESNRVQGIVFESKQGRQAVLAKQVIDATGDADLLFRAGGDYRQITHAIGHVVRLGNIDRVTATRSPVGSDGKVLPGRWPTRSNEGNPSLWWGNSGAGPKGNGLDVRDLTAAEIAFRKEWFEHVRMMRKTPGWEQVYIANTCSQIGPRATRLIDAEIVLSRKDLDRQTTFKDSIGWCGDVAGHKAHQIPFRAIVPRKIDNLLCAGRCLGTGDTVDTFRLICPCMVTGQAAGVAAALAVKNNVTPRNLSYVDLRQELLHQNVYL